MKFAPPRGMRDFYPEDLRRRNALFDAWRNAALKYGFEEYDAPVVETEELLIRKGGEEIVNQIYSFADKSGRRLALRPEMTPSLARIVIDRQKMLTLPLKWFSIPQCFRYERMTKGRKREHYQWNLDIVGEEGLLAEVEVLGAAITALQSLGLTHQHFQVRIGSRAILADLYRSLGLTADKFMAVCLVLDKMEKIPPEVTHQMLTDEGFSDAEIQKVLSLMSIKTIADVEAQLGGATENTRDVNELLALMKASGLAEYIVYDISIIRGLSYYTGIVFEAFDTNRKFRAIFGGGRYDNLLSSLGGESLPCVGLGFGDVVVQELLADLGKFQDDSQTLDFAVGFMTENERPFAIQTATLLRNRDYQVSLSLKSERAKKFFNQANRSGAHYAIYLGPDEAAQQLVGIKDLRKGEQKHLPLNDLKNETFA
ncbi:histidine--tRNA ligase [candidate division KSB1 bacterium]|nr:histidine--tRNA ligase [candidate division KSB1 bacterium]